MKKHKTHDHNTLCERMCDEFNEAGNIRGLALVSHLYIEYYVNEIVITKFKYPDIVIDDRELGSFKGKMQILKAMGLFDGLPHLLKNIENIQNIRNYFAHNLLIIDHVPDAVRDRIKQLVYFDWDDHICDYDVPWSDHEDPLHAQFHVCAIETTNGLIRLHERPQ